MNIIQHLRAPHLRRGRCDWVSGPGFPRAWNKAIAPCVTPSVSKRAPDFRRSLPTGIFTIPEVGMVGETEETLKKQGVDYVVGRAPYANNIRGPDHRGLRRLPETVVPAERPEVAGRPRSGRENATDLVHVGMMMAMLSGATARFFDEAHFNMPTLSELYKFAARGVLFHNKLPQNLRNEVLETS